MASCTTHVIPWGSSCGMGMLVSVSSPSGPEFVSSWVSKAVSSVVDSVPHASVPVPLPPEDEAAGPVPQLKNERPAR